MLSLIHISRIISTSTNTRQFELINTHNDAFKLVTDDKNVFFATDKDITVKELNSNFIIAKNIVWANKLYMCPSVDDKSSLELCRFSVEDIKFKILNVEKDKAKIMNMGLGKCIGYDMNDSENKKLTLVDCATEDQETNFTIKYIDEIKVQVPNQEEGIQYLKDNDAVNKGHNLKPGANQNKK